MLSLNASKHQTSLLYKTIYEAAKLVIHLNIICMYIFEIYAMVY